MQVDAYLITKDRLLAPVDVQSMSDEWFFDGTVRWIKITSATPQEVELALRPLELEPRIVQACVHPQPPQVKVFEKVLFLAMPLWNPGTAATSSVRFVGVATTLITIQDRADRVHRGKSTVSARRPAPARSQCLRARSRSC